MVVCTDGEIANDRLVDIKFIRISLESRRVRTRY